uniref:Uncharacterized protein n=1 Tax=uncultured marine crenarchaeote AD1000-202-A2 TaxID=526636 RepID=B3V5V4_9ARCH|nr:hypothetical protein [uncultured marine crenarchaeote AD1000-202-A2]
MLLDLEKFRDDVFKITDQLSERLTEEQIKKLSFVRGRLVELYQQNLVKINHSVLEIICASELIRHGYLVNVEERLSDILVCDIFATKGGGSIIIEIETGFTPPAHALNTVDYYAARIMSKIARYSKYCSKFCLATPVVGVLPIPSIFLIPPLARNLNDVKKNQVICNRFYKNPAIEFDSILNAHLHSIYLINTDKVFAKQLDPQNYVDLTKKLLDKSEVNY